MKVTLHLDGGSGFETTEMEMETQEFGLILNLPYGTWMDFQGKTIRLEAQRIAMTGAKEKPVMIGTMIATKVMDYEFNRFNDNKLVLSRNVMQNAAGMINELERQE